VALQTHWTFPVARRLYPIQFDTSTAAFMHPSLTVWCMHL